MASALYVPPDADHAHAQWKANCGPCALAAVLGRPLAALRPLFPDYPRRPWTNPTHMRAALDRAGAGYRTATASDTNWSGTLLLFVQWVGPWSAPGVPVAAAYRNTHWIGTKAGAVYDVNAGDWMTPEEWRTDFVLHILRHVPNATGWYVRTAIAVTRTEAIPPAKPQPGLLDEADPFAGTRYATKPKE